MTTVPPNYEIASQTENTIFIFGTANVLTTIDLNAPTYELLVTCPEDGWTTELYCYDDPDQDENYNNLMLQCPSFIHYTEINTNGGAI